MEMKVSKTESPVAQGERIFVKYTTIRSNGVEPMKLTRNAIGYLIRGEKYIHDGDNITAIKQGDIFFLPQGTHYIEDIPAENEPFEQVLFYYTAPQMQQIIAKLDINDLDFNLENDRKTIGNRGVVSATPSRILRNFILATIKHNDYGGFLHKVESERMKLMEIAYLILSYEDSVVKHSFLRSLDSDCADFERVIYANLFNDISVDKLAMECSQSLTAFKKEFKHIFGAPPHQWYIDQRLKYAKLLLITTRKSISQVGDESAFPNTSHFIKLFKRHFGATPANYRSIHCEVNIV